MQSLTKRPKTFLIALAVLSASGSIASLEFGTPAMAANKNWDAATGGWTTAGNWNPSGAPATSDTAFINNGGTAQITSSVSVTGLNIADAVGSSGTLNVSGTNGLLTLSTGGTFIGSGGTGTLSLSNGGRYVFGSGTFQLVNGAVTIDGTGSKLSSTNGAALLGNGATMTFTNRGSFDNSISSFSAEFSMNSATVNVLSASTLTTGNLTIGNVLGSNATLNVDGAGSSASANRTLYVGKGQTGALHITSGGVATGTSGVRVGNDAGSSGTVTINGANSTLFANSLFVGDRGAGVVTLTDGGAFQGATAVLTVGNAPTGNGTVNIQSGSLFNIGAISMGLNAGSNGTINVTGTNSMLTLNSPFGALVGDAGIASMNVSNGGRVNLTGLLTVGQTAGGSGTVTVDGATSSVAGGAGMLIGDRGTGVVTFRNGGKFLPTGSPVVILGQLFGGNGTLNILSDAQFTAGNTTLGAFSGSAGTINVDGAAARLTTTGAVIGSVGNGTLRITNAGQYDFGSAPLSIGDAATGAGNVTINGPGSRFFGTGAATVGNNGAGVMTLSNGGAFNNGDNALNVNGTVNVQSDGTLNTGDLSLGTGTARNGVLNATGINSTVTVTDTLTIGFASNGTANVSDGATLNFNALVVARGTNGTLNIGTGGAPGFIIGNSIASGSGNATINFNHNDSGYVFAPAIGGTFNVNQIGIGTTIITGNNTYTGNTIISNGTLQLGDGNTTGSVAGNILDKAPISPSIAVTTSPSIVSSPATAR